MAPSGPELLNFGLVSADVRIDLSSTVKIKRDCLVNRREFESRELA
jgi:hypothetical protein